MMTVTLQQRKDGGWGWMIVLGAFVNALIMDGIRQSFGILYLEFLREFGQGKGVTSWIYSLMLGVYYLTAPVASVMIKRFGCRVVIVAGSIVGAVGYIASGFTSSMYQLYGTIGILGGVSMTMVNMASLVIIMHYFDKRRGLAFGISTCGGGIGAIVFSPFYKWMIDLYGWRGTLLINAGIVLNCAVCGCLMRPYPTPDVAKDNGSQPEECASMINSDATSTDNEKATKGTRASLGLHLVLFKNLRFLILCFSFVLTNFGIVIPFMFVPDLAVMEGHTRSEAALLISIAGVSNTVIRPVVGWLGDTKLLRPHIPLMYCAALVVVGISTAALLVSVRYLVLAIVIAVFGISFGAWAVLVPVLAMDVFGERLFADVVGLVMFTTAIPSLLGSPIAGWLFDAFGSYTVPFLVASAEVILSGLLVLLIPCARRLSRDTDRAREL